MSKNMFDDPHYEHRACAVCGATTEDDAGTRCQQYQLPSGDYCCPGHSEEESYPDGRLRFLSQVGIDAINAWVESEVAKMREAGQL